MTNGKNLPGSAMSYDLHVVEQGTGRPVILLHGIVSTHRYWEEIVGLLADKRKLITPDLLGFGESPKPRKGVYDLDQYIACLEQTFKQYHFSEPPLLVGHSMGAIIALRWTLLHPEKFSGLVLCSPVFLEESRFYQQIASIPLEGRLLASKFWAKTVSLAFGRAGLFPSRVAVRLVRRWPRHVMEDATQHRYYVFRKLLKNKHFMDKVLDDLRHLNLPLTILIGKRDPTSHHALDKAREVCQANGACVIQVLDTGHQLPLEQPAAVAEVILKMGSTFRT
ncbi:MAG TPA: alpha/beta hydrolase [Candidatus Limnocylindria bacterium]|nr:alpha/beta hydrolase [Candidatus Limnocylindria bacterium]